MNSEFSDEDFERRFRETDDNINLLESTVETAEQRVKAENTKRMGRDRSWISLVIIGTYSAAIVGAAFYILFFSPGCAEGEPNCVVKLDPWRTQIELLQELVVTAVLPIVTLMLGFYFGTETTRIGQGNPE